MNKVSLAKYLDNIEKNKPINLAPFLKLAESFGLAETQLRQLLSWKKIKGGKHEITVLNMLAFQELKTQFKLSKAQNRVSASIAGNSHSQRVSGSLLSLLGNQQSFPQLVVIDSDGNFQTPVSLHSNLLVIENLENFLALIKRRDYLVSWLDKAWSCDIIFADGNAVSNKLHQQFFTQYDKIRCLLDIDLGGFEIFKNIQSLLPHTKCEFLLSDNYLNKYVQYGQQISTQDYAKLTSRSYPKNLRGAVNTVLKYKKFAEQEILLWD